MTQFLMSHFEFTAVYGLNLSNCLSILCLQPISLICHLAIKLTDDDFKVIEGNHQEIYGTLQKHYGYTKEEAEKAVKDFKNIQ